MEIECDLASIRDEDLLRKMWQQSEDFGRKKEIRSHLYKLRESRLREFYSTGGPGGDIMNPSTDLRFGKAPLTPSHGDSLADQSFQSLKSKEVRDSQSPSREIKFHNSGGVAGGVLVPDTTGWDVQTSSEVSPDGRAFRSETSAKTGGVEKIPGGHAEFAGRNEQKSSASHQGDDKNYVKKAAESSKTHLQEKVVIGDENSGRTEMKSSSVTSSSKVVSSSSSQVISSGDPGFDMEPIRLGRDQPYESVLSSAQNRNLHSEQKQFSRNERNERNETTSSVREESQKYVDMDKASPEYQQHVQYLMSQPGAIVSNTVEYLKPGVKMITTVKKLPDGTTVKTKRYETEAGADSSAITSQTMKQQQHQRSSSTSTSSQKTTEKRVQDTEDVFTRLARTRDSNVPSNRRAPETPSTEDIVNPRSRNVNEQTFSDTLDQRSTQIHRDSNQHPVARNVPSRRPSDQVENIEVVSTNRTVKKDLNQSMRREDIKSSDFIQNERERYEREYDSPSRRGPEGYPEALAPITPNRHGRPQPEGYPSNGYPSTETIKQSATSKTSAKFSESRRFSTETVESYQHSENENQDYTTREHPSNRRPIAEPKGRSPSTGRPSEDFSTHGFPSVRSDKPTQQYSSQKPSSHEEYNVKETIHTVHHDRPRPEDDSYPDSTNTVRSNYSTHETRRVTSSKEDFSTHGFPSVRPGTPTRDSPSRPLGSEPAPAKSPRRPSGQEPPMYHARNPPTDGYSTHGFPSVKNGSPTEDSPRRPPGFEPANQGRRPTTEDFSTHGFPSVKPGRSTPTQSSPHYETPVRVDREDTVSVKTDTSNSVVYEKRIDAAHQAFARSLRCASPVDSVRRDSASDRHTPRSSVGSIRNSYSPSKRDGRSPSRESVTNSESSRISSGTVTKSHRPIITEARRISSPKSPIGKSAPSHVSNETIDLSLTRKITARPSTDKTTGRPTTVKEEPALVEPIVRKKIFGATEGFLENEIAVEEAIPKKQNYYQLGLSDATLPSSRSTKRQLGTTPNTSRRPYNTEEELNTLLDTATNNITKQHPHQTITPTKSTKTQDTKPTKPETHYSSKPKAKPEGYITLSQANEIIDKQNQTTTKHVSYPHYIPSAPKADRSPSDRPTTNSFQSPTTSSTTPHNAPKSTKDKVKPSTTSPTMKPLSSPSKVVNSTTRITKKDDSVINRDTTVRTKQPQREPETESETLRSPEDIDEGYVPDRQGRPRPNSQRPTSDDEGFEPESPRAGSPTSDFEYRRPVNVTTYDEEDSLFKKTSRTDKKTVTNDFLTTERDVSKTRRPEDRPARVTDEPRNVPRDSVSKRGRPTNSTDEPRSPSKDRPTSLTDQPRKPLVDRPTSLSGEPTKSRPSKITDEPRRPRDGPFDLKDEPSTGENRKPTLPRDEEPGDTRPSGPFDGQRRKVDRYEEEPEEHLGPRGNEPKRPTLGDRKPSSGATKEPKLPRDQEPSDTRPSRSFDEPTRKTESKRPVDRYRKEPEEPLSPKDSEPKRPILGDRKPSTGGKEPKLPRDQEPSDTRPYDGQRRKVDRYEKEPEHLGPSGSEYYRTSLGGRKPSTGGTDEPKLPKDHEPSDNKPSRHFDGPTNKTEPRRPIDRYGNEKEEPLGPKDSEPKRPSLGDKTPSTGGTNEPKLPRDQMPSDTRPSRSFDEPAHKTEPRRPVDRYGKEPKEPLGSKGKEPEEPSSSRENEPKRPNLQLPRDQEPSDNKQSSPFDEPTYKTESSRPVDRYGKEPEEPLGSKGSEPKRPSLIDRKPSTDGTKEPKLPSDRPSRPEEDSRAPTHSNEPIRPEDKPSRVTESPRSKGSKPPLERSETFEERCRQILGMGTDTVVTNRTKKVQDFIDTERTVDVKRRPSEGSRSPKRKTSSDTVSIEDCDDDDSGVPRKYPNEKTTTTTTTLKTTKKHPRDRSPLDTDDDFSPRDKNAPDHPRDQSPLDKTPRGTKPSEITETTTIKTKTVTDDNDSTTTQPKDGSPTRKTPNDGRPSEQSPSDKPEPIHESVVRQTTKDSVVVDRTDKFSRVTPSQSYPRDESPKGTKPKDRSPVEKTFRGQRPSEETTILTTTTVTSVDDDYVHPTNGSPFHKNPNQTDGSPRDRSPERKPRTIDETVGRKTKTTESNALDQIEELSRLTRRNQKSHPRDHSPDETEPRDRSPTDKFYKRPDARPTDKTTTTVSTKNTLIEDDTSTRSPRDRSPVNKVSIREKTFDLEYPRDKSPSKAPVKLLGPTDGTVKTSSITTTEYTTSTDGVPDDRYPSYTPKGYPGDRSPQKDDKTPVKTSKTTQKTTTEENVDEVFEVSGPPDRSPEEKPHEPKSSSSPRGRSPSDKPRERSPFEETSGQHPKHPRNRSPTKQPRERSPVEESDGKSPKPIDGSPSKLPENTTREQPKYPTTTEVEDSVFKRTSKTTSDETTKIVDARKPQSSTPRDHSPDDQRPHSPSEKLSTTKTTTQKHTLAEDDVTRRLPNSRPIDYTRDHSPTKIEQLNEEDSVFKRTHKTDKKTVINDFLDTERQRSNHPRQPEDSQDSPVNKPRKPVDFTSTGPRDYPRDQSPTEKPKQITTKETDVTVTKTSKATTIVDKTDEGSPTTRPRDRSPNEKPIRSPRIVTTATTTEYGIRDRPRSKSPSDKQRRPSESEEIDETYVQRTSKIVKDTKIVSEFGIDDKSPEKPRGTKPMKEGKESPRNRSPSGKTKQPTRPNDRSPSPRSTKPSDRSPSPRSKYPRDSRPTADNSTRKPSDRSPSPRSQYPRDSKPTTEDSTRKPSDRSPSPRSKYPRDSRPTTEDSTRKPSDRSPSPRSQYPRDSKPTTEGTSPRPSDRSPSPRSKYPRDSRPTTEDSTRKPSDRSPSPRSKYSRDSKPTTEGTSPKPSDRSPSPRSKYPKDSRPTADESTRRPSDRSPSPRSKYPRDSKPTTEGTSHRPNDRSPSPRSTYPRDSSPTTGGSRPRPSGRSPSPRSTYPRDSSPTTEVSGRKPSDRSPSPRSNFPRDLRRAAEETSPRDKSPVGKQPKSKPTDSPRYQTVDKEIRTERNSKTTVVKEEIDFEKRPRERSPSGRTTGSPRDHPRDLSPTDKPDSQVPGRQVPETFSPRGHPRDLSPKKKPDSQVPTEIEFSETITERTHRTDRDDIQFEKTTDRSPRDKFYPEKSSPQPGRFEPTDDTVVQKTTRTTTVEDRSAKKPKDSSPSERPESRDYPRGASTIETVEDSRLTEDTIIRNSTIISDIREDISPKYRPRGTSPTEKPEKRYPTDEDEDETLVQETTTITRESHYPREPLDESPSRQPKETRPTEKTVVQRTSKTAAVTDRLTKSPRDTSPKKTSPRERSPTQKPRSSRPTAGLSPEGKKHYPSDEDGDETFVHETSTTIRDRKTLEEKTSREPYPREPRAESPSRKPKTSRPTAETVVQRTSKTATVTDRLTKSPRDTSPKKSSPRERSPTQKLKTSRPTTANDHSPDGKPRTTSPSEKPYRRQPIVKEVEQTVTKNSSKISKNRTTVEKMVIKDHPREKFPAGKPRQAYPSDEDTDDETIETIIAVYTIDGETVKDHPRGTSPSQRVRTYPEDESPSRKQPLRGTSPTHRPGSPELNREPRGKSPVEKPRSHQPTSDTEEIEETLTHRTSKVTKESKTFEEIEDDTYNIRTPKEKFSKEKPKTTKDHPRKTSPLGKPNRREPTDEDIDVTLIQKTSGTRRNETVSEKTKYRDHSSPKRSSPRDLSPSERKHRPTGDYEEETVISTTTYDDQYPDSKTKKPRDISPSEKPREPRTTDVSVVYTTSMTTTVDERPRDKSPTGKPVSKLQPRDKSPSDKPSKTRPSKVDGTNKRTSTISTRTVVRETDFEKRYPKGRDGDKSPEEKPSTIRRPSKLTPTTPTTTTRNRSNLDEQDLHRPQRPKTQPSTRDKVPSKSSPLSSPRSQPTSERRISAELPSPGRQPKPSFGITTKTTTQTTRMQSPRPKPVIESPKRQTKLPQEQRPSVRRTERRHSPSISPDSSPSRPTSEVELDSPYHRSPNASPSRTSPSPTRSVKLEDIMTSVNTTKKTTVSIDRSKPKVTHVATAKFQVTPPGSPTKVITAEIKYSPPSKKPTPTSMSSKPTTVSRVTSEKTTSKKITKDGLMPTDSERDSEVPSDVEEVDRPVAQRPTTKKLPVTERKESAPVHRVTKVDKDIQKMSRSTSENIIKTPIIRRPTKNEPLEPIDQHEPPKGDRTSPKTDRRPNKHLSTKTINLTTFDKVINSQDMENVVIDIQHAKSSREPSPNKIVPTPVSVDLYTGKPRYPDVVQEPEDEPRKKPNVKNIPIFEEETNQFVGCQITEVDEESLENTNRVRTMKYIVKESSPERRDPRLFPGDNVDSDCMLSVHDKVSKFISTAEEVSKPKTSAPFRRDVPTEDITEDDECLLTVDEKVTKFLKTADNITKEVVTSTSKRLERPSIEDLDEDLKTDECVLSVSEKVNKFTSKAEKLAPTAPQRSPELVARIERQISRQSDVEGESPEGEESPTMVRKTKPLFDRTEKKYTDRQIDILSRPSVWDKKPKPEVKLDDIFGYKPEDEPKPLNGVPKKITPEEKQPNVEFSRPNKTTDSVSKRKELFENKVSTNKTASITTKPIPSEKRPSKSPSQKYPSDESDSRYTNEFSARTRDRNSQEPDDDVHEDVYGSTKTRRYHETSSTEMRTSRHSPERSPSRKSNHPSSYTPTRSTNQPEYKQPSRRYSDDHSPRYPTRDQPHTDRIGESRETSEHTTRRRSSTQEYIDRRIPNNGSPSPLRKQPVEEPEDFTFSSEREETKKHHTIRTVHGSPKDIPLNPNSFLDDDECQAHSPTRSTTSSYRQATTTHRSTSNRLTEDTTSRRPRRPSGNEPSTPTSAGRTPRTRIVPETVAARRNIFEKSPGDISPMPSNRKPSYMEPTKSSLEHRKDSIEVTKTNFSRKSSVEEEPYEPSPKTSVKFGVGLKHKEEPKPKRKLSSSDIPNIEDVFELDLLEEMLNIVTLYEQRRRIRAQIRVVKKLLETKTKEEVSRMTKITTIRKTSTPSVQRESPTPRRDTPSRPEKYQPADDIDSESIIESHHVEEHEEIIRERSTSPQTKTSRTVTKVTEVRKMGDPSSPKRVAPKKDEPKDSKPIWATKNILKKPSENEKVTRALSAKKTASTTSSTTTRTQQTHRQRVNIDDDCVTSSYGIGPTDDDGRPLFGIRALKKKTTTSKTAQPSETTKVTGTVITEKYYSENGAEPVGERKVTVYSTNPEDVVDMETQYDRRDSETIKREKLSKDGLTTVTKVQKIGKYKPGEVPSLTDDAEFARSTSKTVRRGSVKEMSEKFIRKESSSSVTEKSSGYPKAGLILRTRTNSGATADVADQYEVRAKSTEYDYDSEDDVEIRTSRKHSKVVTESEDETEIRRTVNTRSFLNSGGSKVTGVDDVLDRMRNADNVVVDGDTLEDREARSLLNKFLGASVLMTGMESMVPQKELRRSAAGADKKQEVKTTRVTKTIKSAATGGSSSSPVTRETFDIEEIWDEEILKQLLEKSTSYEERRSIRARLRQLMAEREACAELKAGVKAELSENKVKGSNDDEEASSGSEYEEIIEEYTASEDDDDDAEEETPTLKAEKIKVEQKGDVKVKQITEEVKKTTITKKEEPKQAETKKTIVVETTTVVAEDATPSTVVEEKQSDANNDDDSDSVSDSKGESLLIPLLQGLLHKNMPQARSSSGSSNTATTKATTANQKSNNLKSSLKSNNTHFSSTSSNNNNSLGDSGLSSEVSKNSSSIGQKEGGSSLKVTAPQHIEDSGTESGEDLRLIAAGIRDSMQIEGIENHSDMSLIKEVTNALNKLESSLKEGKDLALDSSKKSTLLALVERLQTGLTAPEKLSSAVAEQDFPDETSSPEADTHRSNRQRFAKRKNRNNRHTVGVSKEELEDARRYMEEKVMIDNLSNCTTPDCNAAATPPELFAIQKQHSTGAILSTHDSQEASSGLFRPNQFVPNNLKHSTEVSTAHNDVQLRQKKGTPGPGQRQSTGDMDSIKVPTNNGKRPMSDSFDTYTAQNNRVTFSDAEQQNGKFVQEKNQYNRSHHFDDKTDDAGRLSPDSSRLNRFNGKKQLMKRANTIDIPKTHRYNPEFDTDSDFEDRSALNGKGLKGTVQVNVKRKPRQVVPNFEPKTENDHKFLAFIQKQSTNHGVGWNSSKSVSNWTNKFGNIKNVFESGPKDSFFNAQKQTSQQNSSAKNFWKKTEEKNPPKISSNVLTSALKAKERNEQRGEVVVPKPINLNKFTHNPQSAFQPVDFYPQPTQMQFKPIPMERPAEVVNNFSPTKSYNPVRRQVLESPHFTPSSPTKSWIKKNTATNSPVTLPWTVKPPENNVLKLAATKFESHSPVQRHQIFKQQEKRPSLPNAAQPYHYQDQVYSHPSYMSNSQPASYAEYQPHPKLYRESSLTNPQAEPLILSPNKPAYSPHSLQPFDYYVDDFENNVHQTDMTDDDIDDMESMTEYRVEAKVMGKPLSQQAVTVGKRTSHMGDDEGYGKHSKAAKSLLSVMKNISNGDKSAKKPDRKGVPCASPNGSSYQAPIVEPLFPEVTKFESNREPEYIGKQPKQQQQQVGYQQNPLYVPLEEYQQKQPPVAPPRGRKLTQESKKTSAYIPKERPNITQPKPQPRRDAPNSLPLQAGPMSPPSHLYKSPSKTPETSAYSSQISDGMYMQNVPAFGKPYSEPNTPIDYSVSNEAYLDQYGNPKQKSYPGPQTPVILPQIPLETSFTKVYDQPRDIASYHNLAQTQIQNSQKIQKIPAYVPPEYQPSPVNPQQYYQSPKVQQSPQPFIPEQAYQARADVPQEYYQSPKVQQSPQPFIPEQAYQARADVPQEYYQSPIVQQSPLPFAQQQVFKPPAEIPPEYYQSPKVQQSPQPFVPQHVYQPPKTQQSPQPFAPQPVYQARAEIPPDHYRPNTQIVQQPQANKPNVPPTFYQSPPSQQSQQPQVFAPQYSEIPSQSIQSPKVKPISSSDTPASYYQSPKVQQQQTFFPPETESHFQNQQNQRSAKAQQGTQQTYKSSKVEQSPKPSSFSEAPSHQYQTAKTQQSTIQTSKMQQTSQPLSPPYQIPAQSRPQVPPKTESIVQSSKSQNSSSVYRQQQSQGTVSMPARPIEQQIPNAAVLCKQVSLEGRNRVQSQSQMYEKVDEMRRKSLENVLEVTRIEREAREQKAAAIKQDMYSVQQDLYSQQKSVNQKIEIRQQETKVEYKSSAPDDTPDIVKSSLKKDDIPILKKFGPPQRHCYIPNAYQNPLTKSETTIIQTSSKPSARKFSEPFVTKGPVIVEVPATPQPDSDEIPRNIVFNKISAFTSMSRRQGESSMEYTSQQPRPNKLSKCDSWHQICQLQNIPKPPSPKFNQTGNALRRTKSGHTLAMPKLYEASYDRAEISEKQKTVAAYFSGQKSPNSLSRNSSQTNLAEESSYVAVKKSSINRTRTCDKASISRQEPSSGLSRSHTMPQIANVNLLDESNVEDAFEQLMKGLSTTTTEKTETKKEDGGVVTTTTKVTTRTISGGPKPVSPFAKFQQLDKQNSPKSPVTPTTPGGSSSTPIFRFTDPALNARAATFKEQLLQWCQSKTQEYENVQITNFSASWTDGLAFCALIHHFLPDAFDYSKLNPKQRRHNFELAFRVADEKAGIAPLLDVEDMVVMKRPDWKCVFTYVQSIYRRFRNCQ